MIIFFLLISIAIFALGLFLYFNKKLFLIIRIGGIIFCTLIFLFSSFLLLVVIDGRRIDLSTRSFIKKMIKDLSKEESIPFSPSVSQEERNRVNGIFQNMPQKEFSIEMYNFFYGLWEYIITFDNGQMYFITITNDGSLFYIFQEVECRIYDLQKYKEQ